MTKLFSLTALVVLVSATPLELTLSGAPVETTTLGVEGRTNATPWVASSRSFVAVVWGASVDGKTDVFLAVSRDSGVTFGTPVKVNATAGDARLGGELPPRVALVPGSGEPEIVVLWTARSQTMEVRMTRSRDGGRTFTAPTMLHAATAAGDRGWPALAVDGRGTAHAVWLDHRGMAAAANQSGAHDHKKAAQYDGVAMAQRSGLYYARAGSSASGERELTPGVCYCCKTALALAADGAVYAAWRHVYPGNIRDIAMTVSRDQGRTFAPPVRISEDKWQLNGCPDDGPAMAVDGSGTVHVVWPTVIDGTRPEGALFYATTRDGRRFTPRLRVATFGSPKPSHPQIVVDVRGQVTVAWEELINGKRVAAARRLSRADSAPAGAAAPIVLAGAESAMYPVLAETTNGLVAVWTAGLPSKSVIGVRTLKATDWK